MCQKQTKCQKYMRSLPIHPIWLDVEDKEIQSRFEHWARQNLSTSILIGCIIQSIWFIAPVIMKAKKPFNEQALFIIQAGSLAATFAAITLAIKINQKVVEFSFMALVGVRIAVTFLVLHLIATEVEGFELIDPKQMQDSILSLAVPAVCLSTISWKLDLLVSIPITMISAALVQQQAFSVENDNMSCFVQPESEANRMSLRQIFHFFVMAVIAYIFRYISLKRFLEQDITMKQQKQFQNLFDNQLDGVLIFDKTPIQQAKPPASKKAKSKTTQKTPQEKRGIFDKESSFFDSEKSASRLDSSFGSFVNPTETAGEEDDNLKMVFHNKAILKILGIESEKDLHGLLMKPLFVNREHGNKLSFFSTANSRYSDSVLGQAYIYQTKNQNALKSSALSQASNNTIWRDRVICFQRNEIIFNGKLCIVINVRDLSQQEGLFASMEKIKQLHMTVDRLSGELIKPLDAINESIERSSAEIYKITSTELPVTLELKKIDDQVQFAQLKIQHLKDFGTLGTQRLDAKLESFSVSAMAKDMIQYLKRQEGMSDIDFTLELSSKTLKLYGDKERIQQVLLSCLDSAVLQAGRHGVINLHLSTKPMKHTDVEPRSKTAKNLQIFDFTRFLVCSIDFQPHAGFQYRTKLEDLSRTNIFEQDEKHQASLLALITSQKICHSLFGELKESKKVSRVCYEATFIADNAKNDILKDNQTVQQRVRGAGILINNRSENMNRSGEELFFDNQSEEDREERNDLNPNVRLVQTYQQQPKRVDLDSLSLHQIDLDIVSIISKAKKKSDESPKKAIVIQPDIVNQVELAQLISKEPSNASSPEVDKDKIVVLLTPDMYLSHQFECKMREIGFQKEIKCFSNILEAFQFLVTLSDIDGNSKAADLIFYQFSMDSQFQSENLLKLTQISQQEQPIQQEGVAASQQRRFLPQKVIICSQCKELNFSSFIQDLGAQGFLDLPIGKEQLKSHCIKSGLIESNTQ